MPQINPRDCAPSGQPTIGLVAPTFILGTASVVAQSSLHTAMTYAVFGVLLVVVCGLALWRDPVGARRTAWILCVVFGFGVVNAGVQGALRNANSLPPQMAGIDQLIRGDVVSLPIVSADGRSVRFDFQVVQRQDDEGQWVAWPARLQLTHYSGRDTLQLAAITAGSRWTWAVRLKAVHALRNPGGRDSRLAAWAKGIAGRGYIRPSPAPQRGVADGGAWLRLRAAAQQMMRERVAASPRVAGLATALTLGDQAAIQRDDWTLFRHTGVAHLVSISGLHISLFAWASAAVFGALWRAAVTFGVPRVGRVRQMVWAGVGAMVLASVYASFAGWGLPAQRTMVMLGCFIGLKLLGVRWPWWWVWLLAMALVLLIEPWGLVRPGFWLSFIAVATLFTGGRLTEVPRTPRWWRWAWDTLRVQCRLTLVLAPLTWLFFSQVAWVGLVANLVAIPWVTFVVLPLSFASVFTDWLIEPLILSGELFFTGLEWLAAAPLDFWQPAALPLPMAMALAAWLMLATHWPQRLGQVLMIAVLLPFAAYQPARPLAREFEVVVLDVGQGSAIVVRTAAHTLLFDAGARYGSGYDVGEQVVLPYLLRTDAHLNRVVLSHADADHVGGAAALLASPVTRSADVVATFAATDLPFPLTGRVPTWTACQVGVRWVWDGVLFEVMSPAPGVFGDRLAPRWLADVPKRRNGLSCVLRISNATQAIWLTGDMTKAAELAVLSRRADALAGGRWQHSGAVNRLVLASHHGSQSANGLRWLDTLRPDWVVAQAGYRNRYRHPAERVQQRWNDAGDQWGMRWVETAWCGAATWQSAKAEILRCERDVNLRPWQHLPIDAKTPPRFLPTQSGQRATRVGSPG